MVLYIENIMRSRRWTISHLPFVKFHSLWLKLNSGNSITTKLIHITRTHNYKFFLFTLRFGFLSFEWCVLEWKHKISNMKSERERERAIHHQYHLILDIGKSTLNLMLCSSCYYSFSGVICFSFFGFCCFGVRFDGDSFRFFRKLSLRTI